MIRGGGRSGLEKWRDLPMTKDEGIYAEWAESGRQ